MGTGFWVIQGIFVAAAIVTAIYAEVERRRDDEVFENSDYRRIPVERSNDFTIYEQARLLMLRGKIRESLMGRGRLRDDLVPDALEPLVAPSAEAADGRQPPVTRTVMHPTVGGSHAPAGADPVPPRGLPGWSTERWLLLAGVVLFVLGVVGMWQTSAAMDAVTRTQAQYSAVTPVSFPARVLPGPIANPARYLSAVNGSSGSGASLDAVAMLAQKQAMDRWEALLLLGLSLLVFSVSRPKATAPGGEPQTSVAGDLVGIIGLAALLCAGMSFFELPLS